jgi:(S)-2-hydroxyglutarate dehydrogenase
MMNARRVLVIGGGVVGLATAYRFGQRFPDADITVLEKEDGVGKHQSGNNSGVLHAGLYYKPGSIKARMAVGGIRQMIAFCRENGIPTRSTASWWWQPMRKSCLPELC